MSMEKKMIDVLLAQQRVIEPPDKFKENANVCNPTIFEEAARDYETFWAKAAEEFLTWFRKWDDVVEWNPPTSGTQPPWIK